MAKLTLGSVQTGFASSTLVDSNFDSIESELQNKVLYRTNPSGEPNEMNNELDMNGEVITNLGAPTSASCAARYQDVLDGVGEISGVAVPSQTGNELRFLSTDGTNLVFKSVSASASLFPASIAAMKAIAAADRTVGQVCLLSGAVTTNDGGQGNYVYLTTGAGAAASVSDDWTIVRPDDIASDATAGRWVKLLKESSLLDYGAYRDGSADSAGAFTRAQTAMALNGGGTVYIPAGTYRLDSTVNLNDGAGSSGDGACIFRGEGIDSVVFDINHSSGPGFNMKNRSQLHGCTITTTNATRLASTTVGNRGILVDANTSGVNAVHIHIENVRVENQPSDGIQLNEVTGATVRDVALIDNGNAGTSGGGYAIRVRATSSGSSPEGVNCVLENIYIESDGTHSTPLIELDDNSSNNMITDSVLRNTWIRLKDPSAGSYNGPYVVLAGNRNRVEGLKIDTATSQADKSASVGIVATGTHNIIDGVYIDNVKFPLDIDGNKNVIRNPVLDLTSGAISGSIAIDVAGTNTDLSLVRESTLGETNAFTTNVSGAYAGIPKWTYLNSATGSGAATLALTGIPASCSQVIFSWTDIDGSSTDVYGIQLGHGATPTWIASGYNGNVTDVANGNTAWSTYAQVSRTLAAASHLLHGKAILTRIGTTNTWHISGNLTNESAGADCCSYAGVVDVTAALSAIRLMRAGGTIDAGSVYADYYAYGAP